MAFPVPFKKLIFVLLSFFVCKILFFFVCDFFVVVVLFVVVLVVVVVVPCPITRMCCGFLMTSAQIRLGYKKQRLLNFLQWYCLIGHVS